MSGEEVKTRAKFSPNQLDTLESYFARYEFIDDKVTRHLAEELSVSRRQIRNWFQNKRAAIRRRKFKESGATYPLVKKGFYNWVPFRESERNKSSLPQPSTSCMTGSQDPSPQKQDGGVSPTHSLTGTSPSSSFYASPDTSCCSSYNSSPATSPSHSFAEYGGASASSSGDGSQWSIESYIPNSAISGPFLSPRSCYGGPRVSSPSKASTKSPMPQQPSLTSWRLPLSELSINSQSDSSPDVSPETEYPTTTTSFQMYVTPPDHQGPTDNGLTDIDWALDDIGQQNQMAEAGDNSKNLLSTRSNQSFQTFMTSEMAVAQQETKAYLDLDTNCTNFPVPSAELQVDDAQISSIISDLEADYESDTFRLDGILKFLKDD